MHTQRRSLSGAQAAAARMRSVQASRGRHSATRAGHEHVKLRGLMQDAARDERQDLKRALQARLHAADGACDRQQERVRGQRAPVCTRAAQGGNEVLANNSPNSESGTSSC